MAWITACALVGLPGQARADSSLYLIPSIAVGRAHDDNLFSTPTDTESDSLWRVSPALEAGYESESLTFAGYYTFDAERYASHPELDSNAARRNAAINLRYQATPRLSLAMQDDYTSTNSLAELAPGTIVEPGREHARVYSLTPSLKYALSEVMSGSVGYASTREDLYGGPSTDVHTASLGLARLLSERDTLEMDFAASRYDFGGGDSVDSRVLTLGWTRALTPQTNLSLAAGPRDTDGSVTAELSAALHQTLDEGELSLGYTRSQTAVVGQAGTADTRTFTAALDYRYGPDLEMELSPSYASDRTRSSTADVFRLNLNVSYKLGKNVSLVGSYQYNRQRGLLGGIGNPEIVDNVVYAGLVFSFPTTTGNFAERHTSPFETLWPAPRH
jgi:predicted porin